MDNLENGKPYVKVSFETIIKYAKYIGVGVLILPILWLSVEGCRSKIKSWKTEIYANAIKENDAELRVLIERAVADTLAVLAVLQAEKNDFQKSSIKGQTRKELIKQKFYDKTGIKANDKTIDRVIDAHKADSLKRAIELRKVNRISY